MQKREASSGGYHPTGAGHEGRASGARTQGKRRGFNSKVEATFEFPVGEWRLVGTTRLGKNEWKLDDASNFD